MKSKNKPIYGYLNGENYTKELKKTNFFKYRYLEKNGNL